MAIGAAVVGGLFQASAAKKAARAQENAANRDIAFQRETRDIALANSKPWLANGTLAENALAYENGLIARPENYQGFTKTPGYDFRLSEGLNGLEASAAARGGLNSGAAMKALLAYNQDYGSAEYGNYLNRLSGQSNSGLNAATMQAGIGQNAANGVSNALGNLGNAQAAGYIGAGNAFNTGLGNAVGAWNYQKQYGQGNAQSGLFSGGGLFAGI